MKQQTRRFQKYSLFFVMILNGYLGNAQNNWISWNAIDVRATVAPKTIIRASHLRAFNLSEKQVPVFHQTGLQLNYEWNKNWDLITGIQLITPVSSRGTRTRVYARAAHTTRLNKKINWTNSLQIENNSKNEYRFRQRYILTTRLGLRKRLDLLNLAPSVAYSVFYNVGGNPIPYYDKNAQIISLQTPDGLHRSRFTINLNSKVNDYLRINLYYMRQQEFNLLAGDTRKMNVYDPVRKRTLRPFNNFNTIGLSAQVFLDKLIN